MTARGWQRADQLDPGERLHLVNRKGGFGTDGNARGGARARAGWSAMAHLKSDGCAVLSFFGDEKRELAPLFAEHVNDVIGSRPGDRYHLAVRDVSGRDEARVQSTATGGALCRREVRALSPANKLVGVPAARFCSGLGGDAARVPAGALFTADGHVSGSPVKTACRSALTSISVSLLRGRPANAPQLRHRVPDLRRASPGAQGRSSRPDQGGELRAYELRRRDVRPRRRSRQRRAACSRARSGSSTRRKQRPSPQLSADYTRGPYRADVRVPVQALEPAGVARGLRPQRAADPRFVIANGFVVHQLRRASLPAVGRVQSRLDQRRALRGERSTVTGRARLGRARAGGAAGRALPRRRDRGQPVSAAADRRDREGQPAHRASASWAGRTCSSRSASRTTARRRSSWPSG